MFFIRKQGVIGLAVGFILGGAVSNLVSALIEDFINPLLGLLLNQAEGLATMSFKIGEAEILAGHFVTVMIDFIVVAIVVYILVKKLGVDKLDKKEE